MSPLPRAPHWRLLLLWLLASSALLVAALRPVQFAAQREAQQRAEIVAKELASRIERALALGIPLARLEGVEPLFDQHVETGQAVALALADPAGKLLWQRPAGPQLPPGPQMKVPVQLAGQPQASVLLVWQEPGWPTLLRRWALPWLALAAALAALAAEALRHGWQRGPVARARAVAQASQRIAAGDFRQRPASLPRRDFDPRLTWLTRELRYANEQFLRVQRLVQSLRATEPEAERRMALDRALEEARGQDLFRDEHMPQPLHSRRLERSAARWRGVWLGTLAWALAALLWTWQPWGAAAPLALLALALGLAWRRPAGLRRGLLLGGLAIGPGLALGLLQPSPTTPLVPGAPLTLACLAVCTLASLAAAAWAIAGPASSEDEHAA